VHEPAGAPAALVVFTFIVVDLPAGMLPRLQLRVWAALTLHVALGSLTLSTVHVKPPVVGNGSLSVTFDAVPGPLLVTTIVT
jgi:hypothetical protein